jgi:hypothetical protein
MSADNNFVIRHPDFDFVLDKNSDVICTKILHCIASAGSSKLHFKAVSTVREKVDGLSAYADFLRTDPPCRAAPLIKSSKDVIHVTMDWITHTVLFERYLINNVKSPHQRNKHRSAMKYWWSQLSTKKYCPPSLKLKNEDVRKDKDIKAVGSKTVFDNDIEVSMLPSQVKTFIDGIAKTISDTVEDKEDILTVFTHVAQELNQDGEINLGSIEPDKLAEHVQTALQTRLDSIRSYAESQFHTAITLRKLGREKARSGRHHLRLIKNFLEVSVGKGYKNPYRPDVLSLTNDEFTNAILAYLLFVNSPNRGIGFRETFTKSSLYLRFQKEQKRRGIEFDAEKQQAYIGASKQFVVAAQIILIHELTANPTAIQKLAVDASYTTFKEVAGVDWYKPRAKHKFLTLLDDKEQQAWKDASQVVRIVQHATKEYRKRSIEADQQKLFLYNLNNATHAKGRKERSPCSNPSGTFFHEGTVNMLGEISNKAWTCHPLQLRNSLILLEGLVGGVEAAKRKAQHIDPRTTTGYLAKMPAKLEMERQIREFMLWLETLVSLDIDDFPEKVGIDALEYQKRKEQLLKTQFGGLMCKDPLAGVQIGTTKGQACGMFTKCIICDNRQNFFYTSVDNVVHTLLWNDALNKAYDQGRIQKTGEWRAWAQFIRVIRDRLQKDKKHQAILLDAIEVKGAMTSNPYDKLFEEQLK